LEKSRQLQPDDRRTLYALALALAQRGRAPGDPRRALDLLAEARRRGISEPEIRYGAGLAYLAQGRFPAAIADLEATARGAPADDAPLYDLFARAWDGLGLKVPAQQARDLAAQRRRNGAAGESGKGVETADKRR